MRAGRGSAPAAIAENCPSIAARFAPSPPPSSPASPDCPAAQLHADDEELAGVEGHHQPAIIEVERRPTRIGVRLASVRSLSFGLAPVVASKGQHITSPKSPSRKKKRTKLDLAEAEIHALKLKLEAQQRRPSGKPAENVTCARCAELQDSHSHSEALHRRQHKYIKRQLEHSESQLAILKEAHGKKISELETEREKERAAREQKFSKKVSALEHKLNFASLEHNKMSKEMREATTAAAIASRETAKELANLRLLNEKLTSASARDKSSLLELKQMVADRDQELQEIKDESPSDSDDDDVDEDAEEEESGSEVEVPEHDGPDEDPIQQKQVRAALAASDIRDSL